jgi:hypothetical protein
VSNTFNLTGTDMGSLGEVGTDIKSYINWEQFDYDTDGNGSVDINFFLSDIASARVTSATTMEVVLNASGASKLENASNFDNTGAAAGGADKVILAANAANNYSNAATLNVTQATSQAGLSVIDLGSRGKLIAPVQVNGKWYYHWDLSGDGTSGAGNGPAGILNNGQGDVLSHDQLGLIFNQDINGTVGGGGKTTETFRYATLNGVKLALPTDGNQLSALHWQNATTSTTFDPAAPGTNNAGPSGGNADYFAKGTSANTSYDDMLGIWDQFNTATTSLVQGGETYSGAPSGWVASAYWTATPAVGGGGVSDSHARINLANGYVNSSPDNGQVFVALQVL